MPTWGPQSSARISVFARKTSANAAESTSLCSIASDFLRFQTLSRLLICSRLHAREASHHNIFILRLNKHYFFFIFRWPHRSHCRCWFFENFIASLPSIYVSCFFWKYTSFLCKQRWRDSLFVIVTSCVKDASLRLPGEQRRHSSTDITTHGKQIRKIKQNIWPKNFAGNRWKGVFHWLQFDFRGSYLSWLTFTLLFMYLNGLTALSQWYHNYFGNQRHIVNFQFSISFRSNFKLEGSTGGVLMRCWIDTYFRLSLCK